MQRHSALILFCIVFALAAAAQNTAAVPDLATVVTHMEQAQAQNRAALRSYTVKRDYQLFSGDSAQPGSEVVAQVDFLPPATKKYQIIDTKGSTRGEHVVRHILDHEAEMTKDHQDTAVNTSNYEFQFSGVQDLNGHRCYVLDMFPKRKEKQLMQGKVWVDADTYLIRREEGTPAKLPSWWLKSLHIVLQYGDVNGMWLQTASQGSADVRVFGMHTLRETALSYSTGETLAERTTKPVARRERVARPYRGAAEVVVGTGVVPR